MNDHCKHCDYRGDIETCRAAKCITHESWYAIQQQRELDKVKQQRDELLEALGYMVEVCHVIDGCGVEARYKAFQAIKNAEGEL